MEPFLKDVSIRDRQYCHFIKQNETANSKQNNLM